MTTAYVTHPRCIGHRLYGHPERPARIQAVWDILKETGVADRMVTLQPEPLDYESIAWVHTPSYIEALQLCATSEDGKLFDADTRALSETPDIARLSVGGVVLAVDQVLSGDAENALAVVRPPGHHALAHRAMGFCFLGNVAIAARHAQKKHGLQRVMIVDFDVHHGNGTQDMFYDDDSVLFISAHQFPFYPGSGAVNETGSGRGTGYTVNVPIPAGHGDSSYVEIFKNVVWPAARRFKPELIIVSAGFDAHWDDPLAMMNLSLQGYASISQMLVKMASELCNGRIVFAMEGGYDVTVLAHGMLNVAYALLGDGTVSDPLGAGPGHDADVSNLISRICRAHNL